MIAKRFFCLCGALFMLASLLNGCESKGPTAPQVTVGSPDMEMTVTGATVNPGPYHVADEVVLGGLIRLRNMGQETADTVIVRKVLSLNGTLTADDFVASADTILNFGPGSSVEGAFTRTPYVPAGTPPGAYHFGIFAEVRGSRLEVNTANNQVVAGSVTVN